MAETVEMCEFYDVKHHPPRKISGHPVCKKGRNSMVGLRCHSTRPECPEYEPSKVKKRPNEE